MTPLATAFERACTVGFAALLVALALQWALRRAPAAWRVWLWRAALGQTALSLLPFAPMTLPILPPAPVKRVVALLPPLKRSHFPLKWRSCPPTPK